MFSRTACWVMAVSACLCGPARTAEPRSLETLPPPRPVPAPPTLAVPLEVMMEFPRPDPMAVWHNTAFNWQGYNLPLVVQTPYGSYYRGTGAPFYFTYNYPRERLYTVVGTPYRAPLQALPPPPPPVVPDFMPYID